ncbi:MAG: NTP transferase domain-containing protein [Bacilli bacterium]|nr:NTP transferase domain-containing protein [Bacilli bacterium]MBR2711487.1 NTP transferase domain-containing protein [Bacilli bacterium]
MIIIMCGGVYDNFKQHKALTKINGERLVDRTIRLLKQNGINDIYVSATDPNFIDYKVLKHENTYKYEDGNVSGYWVDAYYPTDKPCIYLHGDVYYSEDAIKKILNYNPKVNTMIGNQWALNENHDKVGEPFGWIVVDQKKFRDAINKCKQLQDEGKIDRGYAISWELYEVLNGYDINDFIITEDTYLSINDETIDIDDPSQIEKLNKKVSK